MYKYKKFTVAFISILNSIWVFAQIPRDLDTLSNNELFEKIQDSVQKKNYINCKFSYFSDLQFSNNHPISMQDGPFSQVNGPQYFTGFRNEFSYKNINLNFTPSFIKFKNSRSIYNNNFNLWNSYIEIYNKFLLFRISNDYLKIGSGELDNLALGHNAPPFSHISLGSYKPFKLGFGLLKFNLFLGVLNKGGSETIYENYSNRLLKQLGSGFSDRYLNGLNVEFNPNKIGNSTFGIMRLFQTAEDKINLNKSKFNAYLPVFSAITKKSVESQNEDNLGRDQILFLYYKLLIPSESIKIGIEYGWNDHKWNIRDLLLSFPHSSSYLINFKKIFKVSKGYRSILIEFVNMRQNIEYSVRGAGNWYVHYLSKAGFTNFGQVLGVSSTQGIGVNKLSFLYRINNSNSSLVFGYQFIKNVRSFSGSQILSDHILTVAKVNNLGRLTFRNSIQYLFSNDRATLSDKIASLQLASSIYLKIW